MPIERKFGFYGILTSPVRGYEYLAELMVDNEIRFIQLRMKKETRREIYRIAERLKKLVDGTNTLLIINDDAQIARDVCADGVHLGQDDQPIDEVRRLLPENGLIGLSTHNPKQTEEACKKGPGYIGIGPVFATPTKAIPDPPLGIDRMKEMLALSTVPAVIIGGIDKSNLQEVLQGGAVNFCSVRPVNATPDPARALKELLKIYREETGRPFSVPGKASL
jgi:thiamine-phosphate pyrophosphorylase